jgi:hypothetical protein
MRSGRHPIRQGRFLAPRGRQTPGANFTTFRFTATTPALQ